MNPGCQPGAPEIGSLAPNESLPFNLQRDSTNDGKDLIPCMI